jgi:hypothetical protein
MLEELFPSAAIADFGGVVTAAAEGGTITGIALQIGSGVGSLTTQPVADLR